MNDSAETHDAIGRAAMAKAMWRIVPLILLACIVAYVDRVNVSVASLQMYDDHEPVAADGAARRR